MHWRKLLTRKVVLGFVLAAVLGAAFYLILSLGTKARITQELLNRKLTFARAEAANLVSFFEAFGNSLAVTAQSENIKSRNAKTLSKMDTFVDQWRDSGLVGGIILTDRSGVVRFNANISGTRDTGRSLADRDYFAWAKSRAKVGEYFVGQPVVSRLGATKGEVIVPVAASVGQKSSFSGVLAAAIRLRPLADRYLEALRVSDSTRIFLVDQNGKILYSKLSPDKVEASIFASLPELEGKFTPGLEGQFKGEENLIAFAPVLLGDQNWSVIMALPVSEVTSRTTPAFIRQLAVLLLVYLSLLLFAALTHPNKLEKIV